MAIDPNKVGNGFKLVPTYYTNPWWPMRTTETWDTNNLSGNTTLHTAAGAAVLMSKWTGGLCVPMFDHQFNGLGSADKTGADLFYTLNDPILGETSTFYTDDDAHSYPLIKEYARGSIFHSSSRPPYTYKDYGIRDNNGNLYASSNPALFNNNSQGAFKISSPGSGLDHYTTYYWGGGANRATTKIKNILGMYWLHGTEDSKWHSWINKICFLYQDRQGQEIPLLPIGNNSRTDMEENLYMRKPDDEDTHHWIPPGCSGVMEGGRIGSSRNASGVLRGAFLHPNQVAYVIENKLELKGMWIEVVRRTPANGRGGDPVGYFHSFFPWILSELSLFGRYYLHPFDWMASSSGHATEGIKAFWNHYYNDNEKELRNDYFSRYSQEVNAAGGFKKALIDPSGKFSKKIIVPPVMNFNRNPQNYSDDYMRLQATPEREYGGSKFLTSNGL